MANPNDYYFISSKLREAVLNRLAGLVLRSYNMEDKAQVYLQKSEQLSQ